jgi:hypothetical protein
MAPMLNHSLFINKNNNITNVILEIMKEIGLVKVTSCIPYLFWFLSKITKLSSFILIVEGKEKNISLIIVK